MADDAESPSAEPIPLHPEGPLRCLDWDEATYGPLTEAGLKARYAAGGRFEVQGQRFPAGARFAGSAHAGLCFVLRGVARFRFDEVDVVLLQAGQYAELPGGDYRFKVIGREPVELVRIWEVPREPPPGPIQLPPLN